MHNKRLEMHHETTANIIHRRFGGHLRGHVCDVRNTSCWMYYVGAGSYPCSDKQLTQNTRDRFINSGGHLIEVVFGRDQSWGKQQRVVIARQ